MSLRIRAYVPGDEPAIEAVIRSVFEEHDFLYEPEGYNADVSRIAEEYLAGGGFWVLADGDRIVGTVAIKRLTEERCELYRLYLLPEFRGSGQGMRLLRHAVDEAKRLGFHEMEIWSDKVLTLAHRLYTRIGARSIGDRSCTYASGAQSYEEWGFVLDLESADF